MLLSALRVHDVLFVGVTRGLTQRAAILGRRIAAARIRRAVVFRAKVVCHLMSNDLPLGVGPGDHVGRRD